MKDYYAILGIAPNASQEDIRAAWLRRVKELHPDVCQRPMAAYETAQVNEAYGALNSATKRRAYDVAFKVRQFVAPVQSSGAVDLIGILRDLTRGRSEEFFAAAAPVAERKLAEYGIDPRAATAEQILEACGWLKKKRGRRRAG